MNASTLPPSFPHARLSRLCRGFFWLASVMLGFGLAQAAEAPRRAFDLAAGPAETTLQAFSQQASGQFIFSAGKVGDVTTRAVRGQYTAREALDSCSQAPTSTRCRTHAREP
jgi:hypothetical protein